MGVKGKQKTAAISRAAAPTAYPPPGQYSVTQRITLLCPTPGARIYYTVDGSEPHAGSALFDPYQLIFLDALNEGNRGLKTYYTIRAIAIKDGMAASGIASFDYTIDRRDRDVYVSKAIHPGVRMISDFDDDKMFLITGSRRALLIDTGMGNGDLRGYVQSFTGDLPLDVVITHGHPDHIAAMGQFQADHRVYMHPADLPMVRNFVDTRGYAIDLRRIQEVHEGFRFDLGDRTLVVYEVPGHADGELVLLDETNGILFAGDAVGSNRPAIVDAAWLHMKGRPPVDVFLSALQVFRAKVRGRVREIYTGHNDEPLYGEAYLDSLQRAAQKVVDQGSGILTPSLRPAGAWQVIEGDRLADPNWAAINLMPETALSAPPGKIATLSNLQVGGIALNPGFAPDRFSYMATLENSAGAVEIIATATSSLYSRLTINGTAVESGEPFRADLPPGDNRFDIRVTSPDGTITSAYMLVVNRKS